MAVIKKRKKVKTTVYRSARQKQRRHHAKAMKFIITVLILLNVAVSLAFIKPFVEKSRVIKTSFGTHYTIPEAAQRIITINKSEDNNKNDKNVEDQ